MAPDKEKAPDRRMAPDKSKGPDKTRHKKQTPNPLKKIHQTVERYQTRPVYLQQICCLCAVQFEI